MLASSVLDTIATESNNLVPTALFAWLCNVLPFVPFGLLPPRRKEGPVIRQAILPFVFDEAQTDGKTPHRSLSRIAQTGRPLTGKMYLIMSHELNWYWSEIQNRVACEVIIFGGSWWDQSGSEFGMFDVNVLMITHDAQPKLCVIVGRLMIHPS